MTKSRQVADFGAGGFYAGKNAIINGDFNIWQRGTSFTSAGYNADRWSTQSDATFTTSRQTFTPGSAPVAGYEGKYFYRLAKNSGGTYIGFTQRIEDVQTFAGQTVTVSLWAKADSATTLVRAGAQNFGSGGSTQVALTTQSQAITTSWARYSFTFTLPSISGKTIGTSSYLEFNIYILETGAKTLDIWGVQLETGQVATPFQTATGTLAGEFQAAQRYYQRVTSVGASSLYTTYPLVGTMTATTFAELVWNFSPMRAAPTANNSGSLMLTAGNVNLNVTFQSWSHINNSTALTTVTVAGGTIGYGCYLRSNNNNTSYLELSAEL